MEPLTGPERDAHNEAELNLPWYVTGRLDPLERARVEAHLSVCAECRSNLRLERWVEAELAELPIEVDEGWRRLRARLDARPLPSPAAGRRSGRLAQWVGGMGRRLRAGEPWQGWAVAAGLLLVLALTLVQPAPGPAQYRTLGATPGPQAGNVVVIFRPDTPERVFSQALSLSDARVVDGPTPAGAYVLQVAAAKRTGLLARLRARPEIVLAQPIDAQPTDRGSAP